MDVCYAIANDPLADPDFVVDDGDGRPIFHVSTEGYLVSYWIDERVKRVVIVELEEQEKGESGKGPLREQVRSSSFGLTEKVRLCTLPSLRGAAGKLEVEKGSTCSALREARFQSSARSDDVGPLRSAKA